MNIDEYLNKHIRDIIQETKQFPDVENELSILHHFTVSDCNASFFAETEGSAFRKNKGVFRPQRRKTPLIGQTE